MVHFTQCSDRGHDGDVEEEYIHVCRQDTKMQQLKVFLLYSLRHSHSRFRTPDCPFKECPGMENC